MKKLLLTAIICCSAALSFSQQPATSSQDLKLALSQKAELEASSIVKNIPFKNIGPTVMSGRVTALAVNPELPSEFYVGYASGGVWHTTNNGTSFSPILDNSSTQNVGDIAVDWTTRTIWVGTGENNASRSSYAGIGILKSDDNGKTWEHCGLIDSHHIGKILINPNNSNEVTIGVTGHLYSENSERGIYKTTDGGKTWKNTLFIDKIAGIIDLKHAPNNYNIMFATAWTKDRKAWNFTGNGENSGIFKSTDAGNTWIKISTKESGLPTGEGMGRTGVAVYNENIIYAVVDNQNRRPNNGKPKKEGLTKDSFKSMTNSEFLNLEDKKLNAFLKENGFQEKYRAENVKQMVRSGNVEPKDIATYLENANTLLFDTPVIGAEIYKSIDGGKSWTKTHTEFLDDLYYSYGYYFGHVHVSPTNSNHIYTYGVPIISSKDGGKTFSSMNAENVHADHHALWINPKNPNHIINGNDGGVNITYDDGKTWIKNNSPSVGQFYAINVDNETPYNVYGGLQDNGVWVGAHNSEENNAWHQNGQYPWEFIMGGDGMQIQIDSRNSDIVYTGYQFGNYYRLDRSKNSSYYIQPKHQLGEAPYRFNWQTPILLSPHNQDILYLGGNKLMRSLNKGNQWTAISPDLTKGGKKGNVAYGTLTSISESPFQFGLLYTGSDDGLVQLSKNSGDTWTNLSQNFPEDLWVSRVIASKHKKERVYITLNGYRWDDFNTYVYKSDDYGQNWVDISNNLPKSPLNVICEDPKNENTLYLGSDNGAYVSFDQGNTWHAFKSGLPNVAVTDIVIQERENHLLLGTHGRSIYKTNLSAIHQYIESDSNQNITLFKPAEIYHSKYWGNSWSKWSETTTPKVSLFYFSKTQTTAQLEVLDTDNNLVNLLNIKSEKGFNIVEYDLTFSTSGLKEWNKNNKDKEVSTSKNNKAYLPKGTYTLKIGKSEEQLIVK
ncbi:MAG: glycosyl hydrolase [Bacteroidetes bacterium MedPE-SWsnd-G2]|nr:MAG: glycosyl hydrolase [Bacteroidetes bacterium MedPE-SWsnd-G2]